MSASRSITLAAGVLAAVGIAPAAHAQIPVTDAGLIAQQTWSNMKTAASWLQQAQQMIQHYEMLKNQYMALAHLPQNVMAMGAALAQTPTLQNPLPQANALNGIVNGYSPLSRLANQFLGQNRTIRPKAMTLLPSR